MRAMKLLGISHLADRPYPILSSGERQKASIARALACRSESILLDEPFANLDIASNLQLMKIFQDLAQDGVAICFSLHDISLAWCHANYVIALGGGRLIKEGRTRDVLTPTSNRENLSV